ncbi:AAA ATPase-like protein [Stackebrandtia albiflava]|uniref:AAA ATPase-like protein n=1 Tax=Stackebrandtia albiflava TaxID=406432 RepID=A0A562UY75_9ACTN|nr:adenylate/guanylate cyclase domain-containing protein [Stackebrandtia albiflava]TWJ10590.1 AAA ATPase-like protein [Stackebrandtia albiflava]
MTCPFCGTVVVVPGARYCHNCGGPLSPVASMPATERRVVTVLFCDLSDFTAWSEDQDPERVGAVTDMVLAECAKAVNEYGGHVDKLTGDGLMAVFGAPIAHDDDAERAVRAAQRMRRAVRSLLKTESGGGVPLGLRVGLRSGLVVAGMQASVEYTVIGDTVNTAARLADAAAVGTVYASAETVTATRHVAAWRRLTPLRLKGKRKPVEVYELLGLHDEPGIRAGLGDQAPFVGRGPEMGRISGRLEAVIDRNEPISVVMTGDAGLGKTRFALESARLATSRGARVLSVRAAAYGQGYRLGPLADLVRKAIGLSISEDREAAERQLRRIVERHAAAGYDTSALNVELLLSVLGFGPAPQPANRPSDSAHADVDAEAVPAVVADLFNLMARETPLMLIVDDLHAATPQALNLLSAAVARLSGPILVLILGRPDLVRTAGVLTRISEAEAYTLTPLRGADAARLLSAFCDNGQVDPEDESLLLATAQGNPYYLAELVTLLTERGMLTESDGVWHLAPGSLTGRLLSADLAKVLTARIDSLPPTARQLLREVAVVGDTIPEAALEVFAGTLNGDFDAAMEELLSRRMLRRRTHGGYRFVTPLMREAAYAGLGRADLADRHARLARWAVDTDRLAPQQADEFVISHGTKAIDLADTMRLRPTAAAYRISDECVAAYGRAASRAMDAAEPDDALRLLTESERIAPLAVPDQLVRVRARLRLGRTGEALAGLEALASRLGVTLSGDGVADIGPDDATAVARTLLLAGRAYRADGEQDRAAVSWRHAWELADRAGLANEQTDALCRLGMLDYLGGRLRRAEERFTTALEVATGAEDGRAQAWALQHLAWVQTSRGDFAAADASLGRAARLFAAQRDRIGRAWVRSSAAFTRLLAGRLREAARLAEAFRPFGEQVGDAWAVGMLRAVNAYSAVELGEIAQADAMARRAFAAFDRIGDVWGRGFTLVVRATIARELGEPEHALELLDEAQAFAEEAGHPLLNGMALTLRGHCLLGMGDAAGAEAAARRTLSLAVPHEVLEPVKVGPMSLLAEARLAQGDRTAALRWLADVSKAYTSPALLYSRRRVVARYAQLLLEDGQHDAARRWALRALRAPGEDAASEEFATRVAIDSGVDTARAAGSMVPAS